MTQPSANGQVPVEPGARRPDPDKPPYGELYSPPGVQFSGQAIAPQSEPEHPAAPLGPGLRVRQTRKRGLGTWLVLQGASGVAVGLAWWVLAPTGLNLVSGNPALADGTQAEGWLPRDLVLAGLFLVVGCFVAVLLDGAPPSRRQTGRLLVALTGGALGAILAWLVGTMAGHWWSPQPDAQTNPSVAFSLRSYAVLFLWPGATAVSTFALNLISMLRRPPENP